MVEVKKAVDPLKARTKWTKDPLKLRTLKWESLSKLGGTQRLAVINDFRRHRIGIQVRIDVEKAAKRVLLLTEDPEQEQAVRDHGLTVLGPHPMSYLPAADGEEWDDEPYTFDGEWRDFDPVVAFWFHAMRTQRKEFGSGFVLDGYAAKRGPDGEKMAVWMPKNVAYSEIFHFRGPGDVGATELPRRTSGLLVPRGAVIPDLDALPVIDDDAAVPDFLSGQGFADDDEAEADEELFDPAATEDGDPEPALITPAGAKRRR